MIGLLLACRPPPARPDPPPACAVEPPPPEEPRAGARVPEVRLLGEWSLEIHHTAWIIDVDGDPCAEVVVGETRGDDAYRAPQYDPPERVVVLSAPLPADALVVDAGVTLAVSDIEEEGAIHSTGLFGKSVAVSVPDDLIVIGASTIGDQFDVGWFHLTDAPLATDEPFATLDGNDDFGIGKAAGWWGPPGEVLWTSDWDTVGDRAFAGDVRFFPREESGVRRERDAVATVSCDAGDDCRDPIGDRDLDGDGVWDLVVGGYTRAPGGRVGLIPRVPPGEHRAWDLATTIIEGVEPEGYLGSLVAAGDVDGDGRQDLLVGAPRDGDGALYGFRGPVPAGTLTPDDADWTVRGAFPVHTLGQAVAVGDLDGDGEPDLIVGAPGNPYLGPEPGVVLVFRGPVQPGSFRPEDADLVVVHRVEGPADAFGWPVLAGDLDGDGADDLVIGAWSELDAEGRQVGSVQVFHGRKEGLW